MENNLSRREFLQASALVGATALASGPLFKVLGGNGAVVGAKSIYVCTVCGHLEFGSAPDSCPVCHAAKEKFQQNDKVFSDAEALGKDLSQGHTPVILVKKQPGLITDQPCVEISARVGKKLHPMEEAHHIRFIECFVDDKFVYRLPFNTLSAVLPAIGFFVKQGGVTVKIVEMCNLHGYWQAEAAIG